MNVTFSDSSANAHLVTGIPREIKSQSSEQKNGI